MASIHITVAVAEAGRESERSELVSAVTEYGEKAVVRAIAETLYMEAKAGLNEIFAKSGKNTSTNR